MARKKEYSEAKVIEKAMDLFWKNGYESTSMQLLEREMGINKFSIYSSFGSKSGVFLESIKCYKKKLSEITDKLHGSKNGIVGIKQYFYDFLKFSQKDKDMRGCLITNTANELSDTSDSKIKVQLSKFTEYIRDLFEKNLRYETNMPEEMIQEKADYYIVSMFGLSSASKIFSENQLHIFIENIFK